MSCLRLQLWEMEITMSLDHLKTLYHKFHGKTIIPLCFGGFGEVNEDLDKVIQCLAREAASSDEGLTISPLVNTDRKGGAYHIMLQQFRRAIAVTAANGHSQQILQLLH